MQPLFVQSTVIEAVVCGGTQARVYGQATVDGVGPVEYRLTVEDLGQPGTGVDTSGILLGTGCDSGVQTLVRGEVEIATAVTTAK